MPLIYAGAESSPTFPRVSPAIRDIIERITDASLAREFEWVRCAMSHCETDNDLSDCLGVGESVPERRTDGLAGDEAFRNECEFALSGGQCASAALSLSSSAGRNKTDAKIFARNRITQRMHRHAHFAHISVLSSEPPRTRYGHTLISCCCK